MQHAVALLAEKFRAPGLTGAVEPIELDRSSQIIHGLGDIVAMLKLPATSRLYPKRDRNDSSRPSSGRQAMVPDSRADILVLGDSFFNVFSLEGMGWGASAGFVEQLSHALQQPIDAIIRNDAGALATRELLGQELARGRDRLNGKRLVVWEFAVRELATGNWDFVPLKAPARTATDFLVLEAGERQAVNATIGVLELCRALVRRLIRTFSQPFISARSMGTGEGSRRLSPDDGESTIDFRRAFRPGDSVSLLLTSWTDAEPKYGGINRGEFEDENLLLEEPNFAELAP